MSVAHERPFHVFANDRGWIVPASLQRRDNGGGGRRIAQAYGEVPEPAIEADPANRGAFGTRQERVFVPAEQFHQRAGIQVLARLKVVFVAKLRVAVPGAHRLAVVAAVDPVADRFAEFQRYRSLKFNRQIGDAAPGVELVGCRDCPGGADVDALAARSAVVAHRPGGREIYTDLRLEPNRAA